MILKHCVERCCTTNPTLPNTVLWLNQRFGGPRDPAVPTVARRRRRSAVNTWLETHAGWGSERVTFTQVLTLRYSDMAIRNPHLWRKLIQEWIWDIWGGSCWMDCAHSQPRQRIMDCDTCHQQILKRASCWWFQIHYVSLLFPSQELEHADWLSFGWSGWLRHQLYIYIILLASTCSYMRVYPLFLAFLG